MKKIFKMMFAVVAGVAALTACTNEPEEGVTPTPEAQGFTVVASMDDATKVTMSDEAGMAWEVGDQISVRQLKSDGGSLEAQSSALTDENIAEEDGKASFSFGELYTENPAYFMYNLQGGAVGKSEFNFQNAMTQESAGAMNKAYLKLRSSEGVEIATTGANTIETKMNIVGTLARFIIYSSNEEYIGEKVQSVEMVSTTTNISGLLGYDFTKGDYYYWQDDNATQSETPEIFYFGGKNISVSLTNPMEVDTRDAESSKGKTVYMPIPPVKVEGYKYIVTTNTATYTFDATAKTTQFNENELKNIKLNLNSASERVLGIKPKTLYFFNGGILNKEITVSSSAAEDINLGYLVAQPDGEDMRDYTQYPELVCVSVEDYNNGNFSNPVDWMSAHLQTNDNGVITDCVWFLDVTENTSDVAREGVIVQDWSASGLYTGDNLTPAVFVTQDVAGSAKIITFNTKHTPNFDAECTAYENHRIGGYWVPDVNGSKLEDTNSESDFWKDDEVQLVYGSVSFVCHDGLGAGNPVADWIRVYYPRNAQGLINSSNFVVTMDANTSAVQRQSLVTIHITTPDGYVYNGESVTDLYLYQFNVTQAAYSAEIVANLNDVYAGTVSYEGDDITVGTLALTADGEAVADANEFCNVAINGGASVALAANGTITATIPANASNTAKEYTVTIKDKSGNALVENVTINQEANPEGGEVVEPAHTFSYTILNNMPDGSNNTGLGAGAVSVQYYRFENITIDGTKLTPGTDMTNLVNDTELVNALIDHAFDFGTVTQEDIFDNANVPLDTDPTTFVTLRAWTDGGAAIYVNIDLTANNTGARRTFKIITKDGDGNQVSSIVYFQN